MRSATIAALDTNLAVAQQVIDNDSLIDRARLRCEEDARVLLALRVTVATDLRTVLTPIRAAQRLERMGDLPAHIAKLVRRRHSGPVIPMVLTPRFEQMGRIAVDVADAVSTVLRHGDIALGRSHAT
jgi:phosphate transport system protein